MPPAFAASQDEPMPAPSAAAAAGCKMLEDVPLGNLPPKAWAPDIAYPDARDQALRARANAVQALRTPGVRLFLVDSDASREASIVAERGAGGWTLYAVDSKGASPESPLKLKTVRLAPERAKRIDRALADRCFWAEPTDLSAADFGRDSSASCVGGVDFYLEAVTERGRRTEVRRCTAVGLTGLIADQLRYGADID
jgi:hypothetical protein